MSREIEGMAGFRDLVGEEIGASEWMVVDQPTIDRFAEVTGDTYFIHVDPERARAEAGLESTIAHGLLTLSLGPILSREIMAVKGFRSSLNYGYDKVRFTAPVPVGSRLRMRMAISDLEEDERGARVRYKQTFEVDSVDRPVCVADWIVFYWLDQ